MNNIIQGLGWGVESPPPRSATAAFHEENTAKKIIKYVEPILEFKLICMSLIFWYKLLTLCTRMYGTNQLKIKN